MNSEELYAALREMALDPSLGNSFRVRVDHRTNPAAMPSRFAIFQNVPFEQLVAPEPWLEQLSGFTRGTYELQIAHESNFSKYIGAGVKIVLNGSNAGEAKFNFAALESETYRGPTELIYPTRQVASQQEKAVSLAQVRPPLAPPAAPANDPAALVQAVASAVRGNGPAVQAGPDPWIKMMEMQMAAEARAEARRREEAEERRRIEKEEREKEQKREEREREREEARRREEREREEARRREDREHAQQLAALQAKQQETLMTVLLRKDPVQEELLRKAIAGNDEAAQKGSMLIQQMGAFMTQMTGMTIQLLHTQAELQQGPQESPIWGLARTAVEGYFAMAASQEADVEKALLDAAGASEQKALGAGEEEQQEGSAASDDQAAADAQDDDEEEVSTMPPVERLDHAIRTMAPLKELADALCMAIVTPELQQAIAEAKGDFRALIQKRYLSWIVSNDVKDETERKQVVARKVKYLSTTLVEAMRIAQKRGVIRVPTPTPKEHSRPAPQQKKQKKQTASASTTEPDSKEKA